MYSQRNRSDLAPNQNLDFPPCLFFFAFREYVVHPSNPWGFGKLRRRYRKVSRISVRLKYYQGQIPFCEVGRWWMSICFKVRSQPKLSPAEVIRRPKSSRGFHCVEGEDESVVFFFVVNT